MEKQETHSLTRALQERDAREDARVYAAAQQEAAHLVWKHQNPHSPYVNPDFDFRRHLKQGSHARSQSIGPFQQLYVRKRDSSDADDTLAVGSRNVSSGSNKTTSTQSTASGGSTSTKLGGVRHSFSGSIRERAIAGLSLPIRKSRRFSGRRSGGSTSREASDEASMAPFPNPVDRIFEESDETPEAPPPLHQTSDRPLRVRSRNTSLGVSLSDAPSKVTTKFKLDDPPANILSPRYKDGIEVRGDDIRAATSMKLKDRSPRLPQPSIVSSRPGRPIVSFKPDYYTRQENISSKKDQLPTLPGGNMQHFMPFEPGKSNISGSEGMHMPASTIGVGGLPSISISCDPDHKATAPSIVTTITDHKPTRPSIVTTDAETQPDSRTIVNPRVHQSSRSVPRLGSHTVPSKRSHWSPTLATRRQQAQCASCALGIEGKIVSAAGERFHPQCFTCYQCGELLECVAFYPEPEKARSERLQRHEDRLTEENSPSATESAPDDGDLSLRFYCHLDFHEKFSPRCRNCKTPIEGKVIVACGGEWHEGHFFCAECGDPFDPTIPFIEKDGYAWCVPCHSRRFSGKCAGCRKPITDMVINALGKEWHENCFCCRKCGSQFDNGRFFTHAESDIPICVKCEERRLKA